MKESYIGPPAFTSVTNSTLYESKSLAKIPFPNANPACREVKWEYFGTNETLIPERFAVVPAMNSADHISLFQLKEKVEQR
jgi:hypothetical protein